MKNKTIAISLLLSFLMVIAHVMIPHHHHEGIVVQNTACELGNDNNAHDTGCEKESPHDYGHSHSFHLCDTHDNQEHFHDYDHSHATTDCDVMKIARRGTDTELSRLNRILLPLFVTTFLETNLSDSDADKRIIYTEFQHLIPSLFVPEANALRGPPFFA